MIHLDFREDDRYLAISRRKIELCLSLSLSSSSGGDHAMAMEIHLLLCILVTALLSLELYAQFSQISLVSLKLNVPSSAYFFKFLSKRSELFTLFFIISLGLLLDIGKLLKSACLVISSIRNSMAVLQSSNSMLEDSVVIVNCDLQLILEDYDDGESDELFPEDGVFDEMSLRGLVKAERQRADLALQELEKERAAAATAAEEALSMILRLQREKSSVEIESNHCRRLAEQKQHYDQQVIELLRNVLIERVSLCSHCQLNGFGDGEEDRVVTSAMEDYEDDQLLSSLELDSWSL